MLYDFERGGIVVTAVTKRGLRQYNFWKGRIGPANVNRAKRAIHQILASGEIHTTSWMPGADWTGTPYEPIWKTLRNETLSAQCFGMLVKECILARIAEFGEDRVIMNSTASR